MSLHTGEMAVAVTNGTVVILSIALAGAAIDDRMRLHAREQRARHEAETANRLKDEFVATLSHELRMPLNVNRRTDADAPRVRTRSPKVRQVAETCTPAVSATARKKQDVINPAWVWCSECRAASAFQRPRRRTGPFARGPNYINARG